MRVVYFALSLPERTYKFLQRLGIFTVPLFTEKLPVVPDRQLLRAKELLRPDEVANILRISRSHVYFMIRTGELEAVEIKGALRVKTKSVRRIIDGE